MGHPEFEELRKEREREREGVSPPAGQWPMLEKLLWVNEDIN